VQVGQSSSSGASQRVLLEALPPVLVLHLKRFLFDAAADVIAKMRKPVRFTPELEIPPGTIFLLRFPPCLPGLRILPVSVGPEIMAPVAGKSAEPVNYKLYGVLYHQGESAGRGHYTVDVLHPDGDSGSGETWINIDDEAVSAVRHEDVFGGHDDERVDDRCAYMLFYCRTASAGT
jgi:ubiquitin carboxyl-terminal hydrolase 10